MSELTAGMTGENLLSAPLERRLALKLEFEKIAVPQLPYLYRVASNLTRKKHRAEDLVQETYLRAFRFFHKFQPGSNCKAWLVRILRHVFINHYWKRKRGPQRVDWEQIDGS
ncbi:MAG TPA: sigma factor, partial [Candidatus Binatia bacterium]